MFSSDRIVHIHYLCTMMKICSHKNVYTRDEHIRENHTFVSFFCCRFMYKSLFYLFFGAAWYIYTAWILIMVLNDRDIDFGVSQCKQIIDLILTFVTMELTFKIKIEGGIHPHVVRDIVRYCSNMDSMDG